MTGSVPKYLLDLLQVYTPSAPFDLFSYKIIQSEQVQWETAWLPQFLSLWTPSLE